MRCSRVTVGILFAFLLLAVSDLSVAQSDDLSQIHDLIRNLSEHRAEPSAVLDPTIETKLRGKNLGYLSDPSFQLTLTPTGSIQRVAADRATLRVRVHFVSTTEQSDWESTATFVRRNGVWYFADYKFLATPVVLIVVFVAGMVIAISYASVVVTLLNRLRKRGRFSGANIIKMFIPFSWKGLFRET